MFFGLIIAAFLAIIPAKIAQDKGYKFSTWYIYGFLLFIVAFIHSLFLKNINEHIKMSTEKETLRRIDIPKSNKVDINADAQIISYEILHTDKTDYYLKLKIQNISNKTITGLKIVANGYNDFHEKILVNSSESFEILLQDLNICVGSSDYAEYPLVQEQYNIRILEFWIKQIKFVDNTIINCEMPEYVFSCQKPLDNKYISFAIDRNRYAKFYMYETEKYWQCFCGNINRRDKCIFCHASKGEAIFFSEKNIENTYQTYLIEEKNKIQIAEEKAREKEEATNQYISTLKRIVLISLIVIAVSSISYHTIGKMLVSNYTYKQAFVSFEEGNLDDFLEKIEKSKNATFNINDYSVVDELLYTTGIEKIENTEFYYAKKCFDHLNDYDIYSLQIEEKYLESIISIFRKYPTENFELILNLKDNIPSSEIFWHNYDEAIKSAIDDNDYYLIGNLLNLKMRADIKGFPSEDDKKQIYDLAIQIYNMEEIDLAREYFTMLPEYEDADVYLDEIAYKDELEKDIVSLSTLKSIKLLQGTPIYRAYKNKITEAFSALDELKGCYCGGARPYYYYITEETVYFGDDTGCFEWIYLEYDYKLHAWIDNLSKIQKNSEGFELSHSQYKEISQSELPPTFSKVLQ